MFWAAGKFYFNLPGHLSTAFILIRTVNSLNLLQTILVKVQGCTWPMGQNLRILVIEEVDDKNDELSEI